MSIPSGAERIGAIPHYTWENNELNGYHLNGNGRFSAASILQERVFPLLAKLPVDAIVADFGCGEGRIERKIPPFGERFFIVRGFELNPAAVEQFNTTFADTHDRAEVADLTRLDVGQGRFDAALFWRVLHSIPQNYHADVLGQIFATLKKEASLHVAVRSEKDWVAEDLQRRGLYKPGEMNDCFPVMEEALASQGILSWPLYFFRPGELVRLGEQAGLTVVHEQPIEEESGFKVLRETRQLLSYDYVEFRKL